MDQKKMTGLEKPTILITLLLQLYQVQSQWWGGYSCSNSYTQPTYYVSYGSYTPETYSQAEYYNSYTQLQPSYYGTYTSSNCDQYTRGYDFYASPQPCYAPPPCAQAAYEVFDSILPPIPNSVSPLAYPYGPSPIIIINGGDDNDDIIGRRDTFGWNEFFALLFALQGTDNVGPGPPPPTPAYCGGCPGNAPSSDSNQKSRSGNCCCCNSCGQSKSNCGCSKSKCGKTKCGCGKGNSNAGNEKPSSCGSSPCNDCGTCTQITIIMPKCCSSED